VLKTHTCQTFKIENGKHEAEKTPGVQLLRDAKQEEKNLRVLQELIRPRYGVFEEELAEEDVEKI
jgi:hypothetical protein